LAPIGSLSAATRNVGSTDFYIFIARPGIATDNGIQKKHQEA
jgi:hypothetical protein